MKRLMKKVAGENIDLYHATSSQVLEKIKESGAIQPSSETGITSNGLESIDNEDGQRSQSGNQNGIYLCGEEDGLDFYRDKAVSATHFDKTFPNIPVDLKVTVNTDKLLPDYDDMTVLLEDPSDPEEFDSLFEEGVPRWKTSLEEIEQVVHDGPISANEITGVSFLAYGILSENDDSDVIKETLEFNVWLDFNEAITQLEELKNKLKNPEPQLASSRLKKIKRG